MDEILFLNKLKNSILLKAGIRTITPYDCKLIALDIKRKMKSEGHVSETTLKRLFGFANCNYKFSKFTIATLTAYVQNDSPAHILSTATQLDDEAVIDWRILNNQAIKITHKTISGIKAIQSIPYDLIISRKFAEHDFEEFFHSKKTFGAYIAQPGYGKTLMMSHLAEHILNDSEAYASSSLIFVPIEQLFNDELPFFDLEQQIKQRLGIRSSQSLVECAADNYNRSGSKLIVMLDGFSDLTLKSDSKAKLFEGIINFISSIEDSQAVKLLMSMRNTMWVRFYGYIAHSAYLKTKWFQGNYFNPNDMTNVPLLSDKELDLILSKDESLKDAANNPILKKLLKQPVQIQFYYQLKQENPDLNYFTNIVACEMTTRFISEKIYKSGDYTEKIIFLSHIVKLTDYAKNGICISKDTMAAQLADYVKIYNQLVSEGILVEQKSYNHLHPKEYVHFTNRQIFEYFLFVELQSKFNFRMDERFFSYIKQESINNHLSFQLLQWAVRFIIRISNFDALVLFLKLDLNEYDKKHLILSVAENLDYKQKIGSDIKKLLKKHHFHQSAVEAITGIDFVDPQIQRALELFIDLTDDDEHLYTYHSLLLVFDILHLDANKMKIQLKKLSRLRAKDWSISPLQIGTAIHARLIGKTKAFNQLSRDTEPILSAASSSHVTGSQHAISSLFLLLSAFFFAEKANTFNLLKRRLAHGFVGTIRTSAFSTVIIGLQAYIAGRLTGGYKTDQLVRMLSALKNNGQCYRHSQYSSSIVDVNDAVQLMKAKNFTSALQKCLECMPYLQENRLHLNQLLIYNLIIEIYKQTGDHIHVNEYSYRRLCFIEEHRIPNNVFSSPF